VFFKNEAPELYPTLLREDMGWELVRYVSCFFLFFIRAVLATNTVPEIPRVNVTFSFHSHSSRIPRSHFDCPLSSLKTTLGEDSLLVHSGIVSGFPEIFAEFRRLYFLLLQKGMCNGFEVKHSHSRCDDR
jgi:hypothetical protein